MPHIESYSFGDIKVDGQEYTDDVIISSDEGVIEDYWWRDEGHQLQNQDLDQVYKRNPDIFLMGIGYNGRVEIQDEVEKKMRQENIEFKYEKSTQAVDLYNNLIQSKLDKDIIGGFHLTC
ncbi:MAG: MTH938/NDUFAF3 family protein [Candidatus Magasanikbacteria bacterium]